MEIQKYIDKMKLIQAKLLEYLDNDTNIEENYQNLINILDDQKIQKEKHEVNLVLRFILNLSNNHYRGPNFYNKIEKILLLFKDEIKQTYSNIELFDLFNSNKRIMLFLIEHQLMEVDKSLYEIFSQADKKHQYLFYFFNEIKQFLFHIKAAMMQNQIKENFEELRKKGENENELCVLIREDLIDEFTALAKSTNYVKNKKVPSSIYETNKLLIDGNTNFIQYAAFFGSFKIFNYLKQNGFELTSSLWTYAVHGRNIEIIHILEDNKIIPSNDSFLDIAEEAIKCYHFDIKTYLCNNYLKSCSETDFLQYYFHYLNFECISGYLDNKLAFFYSCQYGYYTLVDLFLKKKQINLTETIVFS